MKNTTKIQAIKWRTIQDLAAIKGGQNSSQSDETPTNDEAESSATAGNGSSNIGTITFGYRKQFFLSR